MSNIETIKQTVNVANKLDQDIKRRQKTYAGNYLTRYKEAQGSREWVNNYNPQNPFEDFIIERTSDKLSERDSNQGELGKIDEEAEYVLQKFFSLDVDLLNHAKYLINGNLTEQDEHDAKETIRTHPQTIGVIDYYSPRIVNLSQQADELEAKCEDRYDIWQQAKSIIRDNSEKGKETVLASLMQKYSEGYICWRSHAKEVNQAMQYSLRSKYPEDQTVANAFKQLATQLENKELKKNGHLYTFLKAFQENYPEHHNNEALNQLLNTSQSSLLSQHVGRGDSPVVASAASQTKENYDHDQQLSAGMK